MSADRTSPAVPDTTSGYRSRSAVAGRAAGWIAAVILLSAFAAQAYWAAGGSRAAGSDFDPLLPPLLAAALIWAGGCQVGSGDGGAWPVLSVM